MEIITKDKIRELREQGQERQMIHREYGQRQKQPFPTSISKAFGKLKILLELRSFKGRETGLGDHNAKQPA
jgi:hypothetical protein